MPSFILEKQSFVEKTVGNLILAALIAVVVHFYWSALLLAFYSTIISAAFFYYRSLHYSSIRISKLE